MELSWPLTEVQRARTRRFLEINERMSVVGAAGVAGLCAVGAVAAAVLGEWPFAALLLAGAAVFVALGFGQRWWHRRELGRLDEG